MESSYDLIVVGAGPAGLMTAKTAAELGLKVILIEKNIDFKKLNRACSSQFILDDDYENESIKLSCGRIKFLRNNFKVNYDGPLVEVKNKYYNSPSSHTIHFALPNKKAFALKFNKLELLDTLYNECLLLGVDIRMGTIAYRGKDNIKNVTINVKNKDKSYIITGKKLVISEGANAHLSGILGFNKKRTYFATALTIKYTLKNVYGIEKNSWNLFYGRRFFSNAPIIIGPSLYDGNVFELTITGSFNNKPDSIFKKIISESPLKDNLKESKLIDKKGCAVKAFSSLKTPYNKNILVIGDSAAFVEVEVQGALMCGFNAAYAVFYELNNRDGFLKYSSWWQNAFEFNSDKYLLVSQGYALIPAYTDDEIDYLFALIEDQTLEGTYSQYKTPKLIWDAILKNKDRIKIERPSVYNKIEKMNSMTLQNTFN